MRVHCGYETVAYKKHEVLTMWSQYLLIKNTILRWQFSFCMCLPVLVLLLFYLIKNDI